MCLEHVFVSCQDELMEYGPNRFGIGTKFQPQLVAVDSNIVG